MSYHEPLFLFQSFGVLSKMHGSFIIRIDHTNKLDKRKYRKQAINRTLKK